jgi:hypothetical protein
MATTGLGAFELPWTELTGVLVEGLLLGVSDVGLRMGDLKGAVSADCPAVVRARLEGRWAGEAMAAAVLYM